MSHKVLFLDRDGVINVDTGYLHDVKDLQWELGIMEALAYAHSKGYTLIVVTNQSGVARGYYTEDDVHRLHAHMADVLADHGAPIERFYYCPHHPEGTILAYTKVCQCRKPAPGMIEQACNDYDVDRTVSVLIGDSQRDVQAAQAAGIRGVLYEGGGLWPWIQTVL